MVELILYRGAYTGVQVDAAISRALAGGEIDEEISSLKSAVGSPLLAATVSAMTDTNKIYVYTGSETGYVNGNWYFWNGTAWESGGQYLSGGYVFDAVPTDGSTNPVESNGIYDAVTALRKLILASFATGTASGAIASFDDGADGVPVKSLTVQITPVQEGSGDPSPSNVRSISGRTGVTIYVGAVSGVAEKIYNVTWTNEVFGGTATYIGDGKWSIQITHVAMPSLSTLGWSYTANGGFFNVGVGWLHLDGSKRDTLICNKYKTLTPAASVLDDNCIGITLGGDNLRIRDSRYTDPATFKATLSDAVCYVPLLEAYYPAPVIADGADPATLLGVNNMWSDAGDISVTYRADPTLIRQN